MASNLLSLLLSAAISGAFATAALDLWAIALERLAQAPRTDWSMVGRWIGHWTAGRFQHRAIAQSAAIENELLFGWSFHYLVGISYALIFLSASNHFLVPFSLFSASAFGIITVIVPWLILQPGLGMGFFAGRTPRPLRVCGLNVLAHAVFGISLYIGWSITQKLSHFAP